MAKAAPPNKLNSLIGLTQDAPELALEPLGELARLYPSDSRVLYALGQAHLNAGEAAQAIPPL